MKKVILCEGENDEFFWGQIIKGFLKVPSEKYKPHIQGNNSVDEKLGEETRLLRSFEGAHTPYNYLVKAEGGNEAVIAILRANLTTFFHYPNKNIQIIINLDLDSYSVKDKFPAWSRKITDGIQPKIHINENCIFQNDLIFIYQWQCLSSERIFLEFLLFLFKKSLEDETGIANGDNFDIRKEKITEWLKEQPEIIEICRQKIV